MTDGTKSTTLWSRVAWFALLYVGGFAAVAVVALLFRLLVLSAVR